MLCMSLSLIDTMPCGTLLILQVGVAIFNGAECYSRGITGKSCVQRTLEEGKKAKAYPHGTMRQVVFVPNYQHFASFQVHEEPLHAKVTKKTTCCQGLPIQFLFTKVSAMHTVILHFPSIFGSHYFLVISVAHCCRNHKGRVRITCCHSEGLAEGHRAQAVSNHPKSIHTYVGSGPKPF